MKRRRKRVAQSAHDIEAKGLPSASSFDMAPAPAPKSILEIEYENPAPPVDSWWSSGGGNAYPLNRDYEWDQVLAPGEEYDQSLVGASGWVIDPQVSTVDMPMSHPFLALEEDPFGILGDWEFGMAVDEPYTNLISVANGYKEEGDGTTPDPLIAHAINDLKLPPSTLDNGLLGVEIEQGLVPHGFRDNVQEGDRVAIFGRWILDQGHPNKNYDAYRTEIHPPLVMATASVQQDAAGAQFTRALFMSRPYLPGQRYTTDTNNVYDDSAGDDGAFKGHLINELAKVLSPIPLSFKVQFHSKIKSHPFLGPHLLHFVIRPPALSGRMSAQTVTSQMAVSFNFTVRKGCAVQVFSPVRGQVDVLIAMNDVGYNPPKLPKRGEHSWSRGDLDAVYSGAGDLIFDVAEVAGGILAQLLGGPLNIVKVEVVLESGVVTDVYDPVPEVDIQGTSGAVLNVAADRIPAGQGITVDDSDGQPFPVFGWLEARWVRPIVSV